MSRQTIQLSPDERKEIVSETVAFRSVQYWVNSLIEATRKGDRDSAKIAIEALADKGVSMDFDQKLWTPTSTPT